MNLIIVESPTKARTISQIVGKDYEVVSSYGHIRDLPKSELGIDIENNFTPQYIIPTKARKTVTALKKKAAQSKEVILATDEDREGEAIAWHLVQALGLENAKNQNNAKRIVFHEITKSAIQEALQSPGKIDTKRVNAQQARRVLDRLVGYKLSPFLWKKVARGLSAGRVQSVALRLIAEREEEIRKFKPREYWSLAALFKKDNRDFEALLFKIDKKELKKFDLQEKEAKKIASELKGEDFSIESIEKKPQKKNPLPPFTTSTLQQTSASRLRFSAKKTMRTAQTLYEGVKLGKRGNIGLITYMRTDSLNLSQEALAKGRQVIEQKFGKDNLPAAPRVYKAKSKNAQEAHEAVRPTLPELDPEDVKSHLSSDQYKLYNLIWRRFIASQMKEAQFETKTVILKSTAPKQSSTHSKAIQYYFKANGKTVTQEGFLKVWPIKFEDVLLPDLKEGDTQSPEKLEPRKHKTQPPPRYSEATLVKKLEEEGIGRPSTYAPIMSTIQSRGYVEKNRNRKFEPTEIGEVVNKVLVEHFPKIVDIKFTRHMEKDLDLVAQGKENWVEITREFYGPFEALLNDKYEEVSKKDIAEEKTEEVCEKCGNHMLIKLGRYGKFLACSNFPECKNTKNLPGKETSKNKKLRASSMETCPECGKRLEIRKGRYGYFLGCAGYPECKHIKNSKFKMQNDK